MHPLLILIAIIVIGVFAFLRLRKGKFIDKLTKDLWNESEPTSDEVIKDIGVAEQTLKATAEENDAEVDSLLKENTKIGDYLADKGVVKPKEDKGKEADGNEVDK